MEENKIIIYQTEDGQTQIDVRLDNDMVWLTQAQMAELFQKDRTVITRHINNVFKEGELSREEVCANLHIPLNMVPLKERNIYKRVFYTILKHLKNTKGIDFSASHR